LGCEQIFTYSPIKFLQRPVSELTLEQQIQYGEDALASGDAGKMTVAYRALNEETDSAEAQYMAAQLAIELSGVPEFLVDAMDPESGLTLELTEDPDGFLAYVEENGLDPEYLAQAAANLQNAQALGIPLEPMDYVMGTLGLLIDAATQSDGTLDFTLMDADKQAEAVAFVTEDAADALIESLPSSDPMKALLTALQDYANTL
jgi:hypothetical protein